MSEGQKLTLPQAVLFGFLAAGLMVAVGVYLGMTKSQSPATSVSAISLSVPVAPPAAPATAVADDKAREKALEAAQRALDKLKPMLKAKCWDGKTDASHAKLTWNFTFESDGKTLARGTSEDRRNQVPGLSTCLGENTPMFTLDPPPGARVVVDVPFELP
jgi:hypothetical protein